MMDVNTTELEREKGEETFKWQVKEIQKDSEVVFNYAYGDSEDYIAVTAEELKQGLFQVKILLDVELEPQWEVGLISSNSHTHQEASKKAIEEKRIQEHR
jgi:hypothetical protein